MNKLVLIGWSLLPIVGVAYHYGPGQERLKLDEVARLVVEADSMLTDQDHNGAVAKLQQALEKLPAGHDAVSLRLRLERNKALMFASQLPAAANDLTAMLDELQADPKADAALLAETREAMANAKFYRAWLMRLEGQPRAEWEVEIDAARQNYRLIAEQTPHGDAGQRSRENLEAAVRLARLDIEDLQGLPLPSQ